MRRDPVAQALLCGFVSYMHGYERIVIAKSAQARVPVLLQRSRHSQSGFPESGYLIILAGRLSHRHWPSEFVIGGIMFLDCMPGSTEVLL